MATATEVNIGQRFDVSRAASVYPTLGMAYASTPHTVSLSPRLVRTSANFYGTLQVLAEMIKRGELPADTRFSRAAEEHALQRFYERQGMDPRKAKEFMDYFGKNKGRWYAWAHTLTALRVPKGWKNERKDDGTGKYPREVIETNCSQAVALLMSGAGWEDIGDTINKVIGELQVPYSQGHVVREVDDVFGVPIEVEGTTEHITPYALHFWLGINPQLDTISGHYDVAVGRGGWHLDGLGRCLYVAALGSRSDSGLDLGFRPVRGSVPEIEVVSASVDIGKVRQEFTAQVASDLRKLPLPELLTKYQL